MSDDDATPVGDELEEIDSLEVDVPPLLAGARIDRALSMLTGITRKESAALVASGAVDLDGRVVTKASMTLAVGQRLVATLPGEADDVLEAEADVDIDVVIEDAEFVIVDKSPGLVVHPGAGHRTGTLIAGLLARYPEIRAVGDAQGSDPMRPGVVHRLDKGTSGLLVVARTERAYASLSAQLAGRAVERTYTALVEGTLEDDHGIIDAPIARSQRTPTKMAVRASGRPARTAYEVLIRASSPPRTLCELRLESGRTHQIRVHMAAIGRPVVNDPRYGRQREPALEEGRVFLHAGALGFEHPVSGERVRATSALPSDLEALRARLRG